MAETSPEIVKVFIRHAKSVNNELAESGHPGKDRVGGYQPNVKLAEAGKEQATRLGEVIMGNLAEMLGKPVRLARFSAAPAVRTRQTAHHMRAGLNYDGPITILPHMHELCKGNKWLGGDEKRLRAHVETAEYKERREHGSWDFRSGRPWANRLGLYRLHGGETPREVGARILPWFLEVPPLTEADRIGDAVLVDAVVSHGLAGRYAMGQLLHTDPSDPTRITIGVQEADEQYHLANATAFVVSRAEDGSWIQHGRIAA